nr:vacuolar protein sorting-associated protein 22 homolog 1 [Ipomoea batatas]
MRRRPGIGGLQNAATARGQYRLLGENVAKLRTDLMKEQLATFRTQLEDFARKHKVLILYSFDNIEIDCRFEYNKLHFRLLRCQRENDIRKNPAFRSQFHEMCAKIGVDPLASNKGFWVELLGIGDFYYELGVQIIDICLATRPHNGGLISLEELCKILAQKRKGARETVSEDDCLRAISKLKVLGNGFEVISVGKRKLVRSVPTELNKDHNEILELAQTQGFVTVDEVQRRLNWSSGRATDTLETLLKVWLWLMMGTVMADADIGFLVYHLSLPMLDLIQLEHFPGYCVMKEIEAWNCWLNIMQPEHTPTKPWKTGSLQRRSREEQQASPPSPGRADCWRTRAG